MKLPFSERIPGVGPCLVTPCTGDATLNSEVEYAPVPIRRNTAEELEKVQKRVGKLVMDGEEPSRMPVEMPSPSQTRPKNKWDIEEARV